MIEVVIKHTDAGRIMEIVRELRAQGLDVGVDFDFNYRPAVYNSDGWEAVSPKQTVFTFYREKWATWFVLRYL